MSCRICGGGQGVRGAPDAGERGWVADLIALYQEKLRSAAEIVPLTELFFLGTGQDEAEAAGVLARSRCRSASGVPGASGVAGASLERSKASSR